VDFEEAVEKAPPGWLHFRIEDVDRLPSGVRAHELARIPRGETDQRILRGLFWTLIYHLEPGRWDELARHEPIAAGLLDALPQQVHIAIDVGAGSGRLTEQLVTRATRTFAVEPSAGLRALLTRRLPMVRTLAGWAERLPLRDDSSQLTAACGAFGPDTDILAELERVTAPGGTIALVSPEQPDWFEEHGWERVSVPSPTPPPHPAWLDDFFGPLDPPHEMVMRRLEAA
jgi:SAM-dependent methyltransferase